MRKATVPHISEKTEIIAQKLRTKERLTRGEENHEVTRDEAAYLLSIIAGRDISPRYISQLTRQDAAHPKARLEPSRISGNTYLYRVGSLLTVRFNRVKGQAEQAEEHQEDRAA
jgi:hypothetical protein